MGPRGRSTRRSLALAFFPMCVLVAPPAWGSEGWDIATYAGVSVQGDDGDNTSAPAFRVGVTRASAPRLIRWAGEVGYLGLGWTSYASTAVDGQGTGGGTIHYNAIHAGPLLRIQTTGTQRVQAYTVLGVAPYALKFKGEQFPPSREVRIGGSAGVGMYGLAPGMFGLELRWHVIDDGANSPGRPLHLVSLLGGINF
jgi:hypothetical protein